MYSQTGKFFVLTLAAAMLLGLDLRPGPARAQSKKTTKLLVMKAESESLDDSARKKLTENIRAGLGKYSTLSLLPTPNVDLLDIIIELECTDMDVECFQKIADQYKAAQVLYIEAKGAAAAPEVTLKYYDRKKNKILQETNGVAASAEAIALMLVQSIGPVPVIKKDPVKPPPRKTRVLVKMTSSVPGAMVTMNKFKLGVTPLKRKLKPGGYTVVVEKDGYVVLKQRVVVKRGAEQSFNFNLVQKKTATKDKEVKPPVDDKPPPTEYVDEDGPFYTQWWFWTAVGVGVVGIVTTSVLLSVDDEPMPTGTVNFGVASPDYDPLVRGNQ